MTIEDRLVVMEPKIILRATVGSTLHGLHADDGTDDRDEMAVAVEDLDETIGFAPFEQLVYRTAAIREASMHARSMAGDLDLVVYSLRKFLRLALKMNPTILCLFYAPADMCVTRKARGAQLQELRDALASTKAFGPFMGYLTNQKERLLGIRGQKDVNRPELVARYGYDTKYAMHMCRLGIQGVELLKTGTLTLPMREPDRTWLRDLRWGKIPEAQAIERVEELENDLALAVAWSPLPPKPDFDRVQAWMCDTYYQTWKAREPRAGLP